MSSLNIPCWSQANCPYGSWDHLICVFLMALRVRPKLINSMFLPIKFPSSHNVSRGVFGGDPVSCRQSIQPQYSIFNQVNQHDSGNVLVWKDLIGALDSVFHCTNVSLNFRHMFIHPGTVQHGVPWTQWFKLLVCGYNIHTESTMRVKVDDCLQFVCHSCNLSVV